MSLPGTTQLPSVSHSAWATCPSCGTYMRMTVLCATPTPCLRHCRSTWSRQISPYESMTLMPFHGQLPTRKLPAETVPCTESWCLQNRGVQMNHSATPNVMFGKYLMFASGSWAAASMSKASSFACSLCTGAARNTSPSTDPVQMKSFKSTARSGCTGRLDFEDFLLSKPVFHSQ